MRELHAVRMIAGEVREPELIFLTPFLTEVDHASLCSDVTSRQ